MLIRLSQSMALEIRHLRKRGEIYQFYLRVPVDLVPRYGQEFIRQSLRTSDERIAVRKATEFTKRYRREFEILRGNPQVAPQGNVCFIRDPDQNVLEFNETLAAHS